MSAVVSFARAVAPWIIIGLWVAITVIRDRTAKEGKKVSRLFDVVTYFPSLCFLFVAALEFNRYNNQTCATCILIAAGLWLVNLNAFKQEIEQKRKKKANPAQKTEAEES